MNRLHTFVFRILLWRVKRSALRLRLTGSVVQPMSCYDLLTCEAIGSNYLSFVVILLLASTTPLAEAGTATHFPLSESSGRKWPADVGYTSANHPITSGSPVCGGPPSSLSREGPQFSSSLIDYSSDCLFSNLLYVTKMNSQKLP